MAPALRNAFSSLTKLSYGNRETRYYSIAQLEREGVGPVSRLPLSLKVLLEALLRTCDDFAVTEKDIANLANWDARAAERPEIPFKPARVILQDFTGVPALADVAAMRDAMKHLGGDPSKIQPGVPVDLVIDHSVQIDAYGSPEAMAINTRLEFERNTERYQFLKWGQSAVKGFRVVPPGMGIVHQVNLEHIAPVTFNVETGDGSLAYPDTVVGTDSHTPMINGIGVVGWGVGGIEAEAVMLGQPIYMLMPDVIGFKLTGALPEGTTATDMVLTITNMLRKKGVVGTFVEFYGPGLTNLSLTDRATIANMSPEHGCTICHFPIDAETLRYMRMTGRDEETVLLTEAYAKAQGLFRTDESPDPVFTDTLELDLSTIQPCLAGPKRPQDQVFLNKMKQGFHDSLKAPVSARGYALEGAALERQGTVRYDDGSSEAIRHGAVVIAAITSCTNTSNPSVMLGAGLVAKKAVARGLRVPRYVKTSLAPGSTVVTDYLERAGVIAPLAALGFDVVAYGCTTCIGNSGPLPTHVAKAIEESDVVAAAVLSGNRNFEGRVNPLTKANYLASPPLVVAYALAGTVDIDLVNDPIGTGSDGRPVYLRDIWPSNKEIADAIAQSVRPEMFRERYNDVWNGTEEWRAIEGSTGALYSWDAASTYIQRPPFFDGISPDVKPIKAIHSARCIAILGDSVTTDHISPAGNISKKSPAAAYLRSLGVKDEDFNSYGARRGNHHVMVRGTYANIRLRNMLAPGTEGGVAPYLPTGEILSIFDACDRYAKDGTPLVVLGGKEYGSGSSRDWAAKGPWMLGIKVVIAESFERIHRSNLVGMGLLPLQFLDGQNAQSLGLSGHERYDFPGLNDDLRPQDRLEVVATSADGTEKRFTTLVRIDTPVEIEYYRNGGILQTVLRKIAGTV